MSDEIAGDEDEVGSEFVNSVDDALEEEGFGELVEVDVAYLSDAVAVKRAGQIFDGDGAGDDVELVA